MFPVPHRKDWTNDLNILPASPEDRIIELNLANIDPILALMIESRVGAFASQDRENLEIVSLPVEDEDVPHLIKLAIQGESTRTDWKLHSRYLTAVGLSGSGEYPAGLTLGEYLARTPIARTRRWLTTARINSAKTAPIVCVIGDTANDHALAMNAFHPPTVSAEVTA